MTSWKKAAAMIAGLIIVAVADRLGVDATTIAIMGGLVSSYVVGQGMADWGKNAQPPVD